AGQPDSGAGVEPACDFGHTALHATEAREPNRMNVVKPSRRRTLRALSLAIASACAPAVARGDPFYMGGDVSLPPFIESKGGSFRDDAQVRPMEQIMVNHGDNLFRLRLFVNPNTNYNATQGAIQDLNYTISLAQRLKATGAKILLDLHYSDTWA